MGIALHYQTRTPAGGIALWAGPYGIRELSGNSGNEIVYRVVTYPDREHVSRVMKDHAQFVYRLKAGRTSDPSIPRRFVNRSTQVAYEIELSYAPSFSATKSCKVLLRLESSK